MIRKHTSIKQKQINKTDMIIIVSRFSELVTYFEHFLTMFF